MKPTRYIRAFVTFFAVTNLAMGLELKDGIFILVGAFALGIRELLRE